jgi:glutamate-1-semialdehyde 2,1-aminomutase/spore coat polysaccharide biosynthesis protein SpsF
MVTELGVAVFSDLTAALDAKKYDAVFICSPPVYHLRQALESLRTGSHLFIEKPLSHSLDGIEELVGETRSREQVVQVGYNLRFHPGLRKLKELIETGILGRVLWAQAEAGQYLPDWRPWQNYRESYTARRVLGGGILLDGSHELDYIMWLLGKPAEIMCMAAKVSRLEIDVEDCADILLRFASGAQAVIHLDFVQRERIRCCKLVGEQGSASWNFARQEVQLQLAGEDVPRSFAYSFNPNDMYLSEVEHFFDCIVNRRRPLAHLQGATEVLRVAMAAHSSARKKCGESLELDNKTVVAIVQARMSSTRLPGKVLADVAGHPMLWHLIQRLRRSRLLSQIVVATTENPSDDVIVRLCESMGVVCFRGSESDVLDRYYQAARAMSAHTVVRITSDCPLIDPVVVDKVIQRFLDSNCDYVSNSLRYTYPNGLDTEVFSFAALERAWREATRSSDREHVTPFLKRETLRIANVENEAPLGDLRWTVDESADLEFVRRVFVALSGHETFGMQEVLDLVKQHPEIQGLNDSILSNEGYYRSLYEEAVASAAPRRPLEKSWAWFRRSQVVIPGCAQTFSKGFNQYVEGVAPIFLERGKGCRVWDVDGNEYIDYVQGLLPNLLGYSHEEVNVAVTEQLSKGQSFSLPHPLEVELAERLIRLIPCAEMVRFGKNGSDATAGAVRAARAFTGREHIACCGYHGWQDWYIGSTTRNAGVPVAVRELTHPFPYNDLPALEKVLDEHRGQVAAIIMEPVNFTEPAPGYLAGVKEAAQRHGALLIFDEICSGFHFGLGGAQKRYNVIPDLACFGKAMGNGFPISCVLGRADVMKIFEVIFFSFTFGGEVASMAAALKVLDILEHTDALERMETHGLVLRDSFNALAKVAGLSDRLTCVGNPSWSLIKFLDAGGKDSMLLRSLVSQEMVKRGVLILATHNMTAAHDHVAIQQTLEAYAAAFKTIAGWLQEPQPERFLEGKMIQPVFRVR